MNKSALRRMGIAGTGLTIAAGLAIGCGGQAPSAGQSDVPSSRDVTKHHVQVVGNGGQAFSPGKSGLLMANGHSRDDGARFLIYVYNATLGEKANVQIKVLESTPNGKGLRQVTPKVLGDDGAPVMPSVKDGRVYLGDLPYEYGQPVEVQVPRLGNPASTRDLGGKLELYVNGRQVGFKQSRAASAPVVSSEPWGNTLDR